MPRKNWSRVLRPSAVGKRLANRLGRLPSPDEVAEELDMDRDRLHRIQDRVHRSVVLALDHYVAPDDDEELTLVDVLADPVTLEPDADVEVREMRGYLRDAVGLLPERHRAVVVGHLGDHDYGGEEGARGAADCSRHTGNTVEDGSGLDTRHQERSQLPVRGTQRRSHEE